MKIVYARISGGQIVLRVVPTQEVAPKPIGNEPATKPVFSYTFPLTPPSGKSFPEYIRMLPGRAHKMLQDELNAPHFPPEVPLSIEGEEYP